jgi:hypothetical protein
MKFAIAGLILAWTSTASAQKLDVKIVDRQDSATGYTYFAPGHFNSQSNANLNCYGDTSVNCYGSSTTNGTITAPHRISYEVRGATFTLLLPDGRAAVVNCESKYMPKGDYINRRSCRMPLLDDIRAEFHGDKAKLEWIASLDGKKMQSETYKVLAILGSPKSDQPKQQATPASAPTAFLLVFIWRRRRDSNPRDPFGSNGFQDRRFQPLTHSSVFNSNRYCLFIGGSVTLVYG